MPPALLEQQAQAFFIPQQELLRRPLETSDCIDAAQPKPKKYEDGIFLERLQKNLWHIRVHSPDTALIEDEALIEHAITNGATRYGEERRIDNFLVHPAIANRQLSIATNHYGLGAPAITREFHFNSLTGEFSAFDAYLSRVKTRRVTHEEFDTRLAAKNTYEQRLVNIAILMTRAIGIREGKRAIHHSQAKAAARRINVVANVVTMRAVHPHIPLLFRVDNGNGTHYSTVPKSHKGMQLAMYGSMGPSLRKPDSFGNALNFGDFLRGREPRLGVDQLERIVEVDERFKLLGRTVSLLAADGETAA